MNKLEWTKPYCGVEHLKGLPEGYQITMEDEKYTFLLNLKSPHPFTEIKFFRGTPEQTRHTAEEWGIRLRDEFGIK